MDQTEHLPAYVYLSLGMKIMVTCNIATTINLANGSRGTIVDIILDPRESQLVTRNIEHNIVHLQFPPAAVVLQLDFTRFPIVPGLQQGQAPLFPIAKKFRIGKPSVSVQRRQLPLTPAYAFTDFKSQGQTINHVIVDLGKTVQFALSPFNAYVALSRSKGRDTIRLLRDFEDNLFTRHPSENLREEELRLTQLAENTKTDYYNGKYNTCQRKVTL
jgi:ATP-dependent exoDNAse (exonuclease V) alpha subunit